MLEPGLMQNATAVGAAFAASLVECVEALTIVLAVGVVSGWRSGLLGAASGAVLLAAIVALTGGALVHVPLNDLHVLVGAVLLVFGFSWLRKAVLRTAGMRAHRDEAAIFSQQIEEMRLKLHTSRGNGLDLLAFTAAFKAVIIEGIEVVFIVVTVGHFAGALIPAALGAAAAALVVVTLGIAIHRPLIRVPENVLKFGVGVIIVSFGIFWLGEGLGLAWPGGDLAMAAIIAAVFVLAHLCAAAAAFRVGALDTTNILCLVPMSSVVRAVSFKLGAILSLKNESRTPPVPLLRLRSNERRCSCSPFSAYAERTCR